MIGRLLAKSRQALSTAARDLDNGDMDAAANRCYYAVYYAAWAMFAAFGLERPKTHSGLISEFSKQFVKDGPVERTFGATLGKLESLRAYADYTLEPTPREKAEQALDAARTFVAAIEAEIKHRSPQRHDG
ncbi:MAG: HEPN domain-containing protein [Lamprobacter sp.]|uniref:HEPN domain-containing protein n=1 Tax=Lamprobacter sp. TaxID=3100796 RepID=UPI002B263E4A|nr:HEPN domain-containing protein [Lamprobacter sp.]MEA3643481.1 HEPN domain-containing protein [Lamprobacter sp.]